VNAARYPAQIPLPHARKRISPFRESAEKSKQERVAAQTTPLPAHQAGALTSLEQNRPECEQLHTVPFVRRYCPDTSVVVRQVMRRFFDYFGDTTPDSKCSIGDAVFSNLTIEGCRCPILESICLHIRPGVFVRQL
jgi:hypothetical protein